MFPPPLWVLDPPDVGVPITPSAQGWKRAARRTAGSMKESWEQLKAHCGQTIERAEEHLEGTQGS